MDDSVTHDSVMDDDRAMVVEAFAGVIGEDAATTLESLLPARRWREALPEDVWLTSEMMSHTDEGRRQRLYTRLTEVLGEEAATATMEYLPPVPMRVLQRRNLAHLLRRD